MMHRPPNLPTDLLRLFLPDGPGGSSILGDLEEEWHRRSAGPRRIAWYWSAVLIQVMWCVRSGVERLLLDVGRDVRLAARRMARNPTGALLMAALLSLGVAAPVTMFSIVQGLSRTPQVPDPDGLVHVGRQQAPGRIGPAPLEWLMPVEEGLEGMGPSGIYRASHADISGDGMVPERVGIALVEPSVLEALAVSAAMGRTLEPEDSRRGERVVVLGWRLWRERWSGDPDAVGRSVRVNGRARTVVGIMPEGFHYPGGADIWVPLSPTSAIDSLSGGEAFEFLGRLSPGSSLQGLRHQVESIEATLAENGFDLSPDGGLTVQPWTHRLLAPNQRRTLQAMVLLVSFVLLVACANLAHLLLARALARRRETGLRLALGSGSGRIVRQHLFEAGTICAVGGVVGFALAMLAVTAFEREVTDLLAYWMDIRVDLSVVLFCLALITVAAVVSGVLPAVQAARLDVADTLAGRATRGSSTFRIGRLSHILLAGEIALSSALLVAAGVMVRGALNSLPGDGAFATRDVLAASFELRADGYPSNDEVRAFHGELLERLQRDPAIAAVTLTSHIPGGYTSLRWVEIEGETYERPQDRPWIHAGVISPGFFETLEGDLLRGRALRSDGVAEPREVLVNEAFVRRHFSDEDQILGSRVRLPLLGADEGSEYPWATVVGVAPQMGMAGGGALTGGAGVYVSLASEPVRTPNLLIRPTGRIPVSALLPRVRTVLSEMDSDVALFSVASLDEKIARSRAGAAIIPLLFVLFGVVALVLAVVGLFGLLSFRVRQRAKELGVRAALGARGAHVTWCALRAGVKQVVIGLVVGLGLGAAMTPTLGPVLLGTDPRDPLVYVMVAALMSFAAAIAMVGPASRVLSGDVVQALRIDGPP